MTHQLRHMKNWLFVCGWAHCIGLESMCGWAHRIGLESMCRHRRTCYLQRQHLEASLPSCHAWNAGDWRSQGSCPPWWELLKTPYQQKRVFSFPFFQDKMLWVRSSGQNCMLDAVLQCYIGLGPSPFRCNRCIFPCAAMHYCQMRNRLQRQ
jgi:hypothetical protein